jgi:hypothetical protein
VRTWLRRLGILALGASAAFGIARWWNAPLGPAPDSATVERARFLERVRRAVPAGAPVLALTELHPPTAPPDFDFWVGNVAPAAVLIRLRPNPDFPDVERYLRAQGKLLEEASLSAGLAWARYVVVADLEEDLPELTRTELLFREGPRALYRALPP